MSTLSQRNFMANGGPLAGVLEAKYQSGELQREYTYQEYPKYIRIPRGTQTVTRTTTAIRGKNEIDVQWEEEAPVYDEHWVNSEEEEEAVLSGGKSQLQLETERQQMISDLRSRGMQVDPTWTYVRLQREMGSMPPREAVEALQRKVEVLENEAKLRARIAELEAQLNEKPALASMAQVDETEALREELRQAGVAVDKRWSLATLRQQVEALGE